jgi:signal transduction histidine kinase
VDSTEAVLAVARDLLADLDLERVLERVVTSARQVTGARYGAVGVLSEDRKSLDRFITSGIDAETRLAIGNLPTGRGVLGELIWHPAPLRIRDIGAHPHSYGFPIGHPVMRSFLGVPILIRGHAFGNLYLTEKLGADEFTAADEEAAVLLSEFAALAIDHAKRYTGSERRREELQQTVAALDATLQIARAIGGQTDLDTILELVAKRGRALVSARALVIEHIRDDSLVVAAAVGEVPSDIVGRTVDLGGSLASSAIQMASTVTLEEGTNRRRFDRHGLGRLGFNAAAGLVVPLVFRGRAYGALVAVDRLVDGPVFTQEDVALLEAFAASAATALATAETAASEQRRQRLAATEDERRRWARELHDETLQALAALRLRLATAQRVGSATAIGDAMTDAVNQIDTEITNLRSLITELRPAALDELGVTAAVEALAERARARGLNVVMNVGLASESGSQPTRLAPEIETAIYRITQEALTNAQKNGGAAHAEVRIVEADDQVTVEVEDNGSGFDPAARSTGFGLTGMQERAELLGGRLEIISEPGAGALVRCVMPISRVAGSSAPGSSAAGIH